MTAFGTQAQTGAQDFEVSSPPSDGISSLGFSPSSNFLAATSWGAFYFKCVLCVPYVLLALMLPFTFSQ